MRRSFGAEVIHMTQGLFREIVATLFPISCIGCGTNDTPLCSSCASRITSPESSPDLIAAWSFHDPHARTLIHSLKYRSRTSVARVCAAALAERLIEEIAERRSYQTFTVPLVVPIPLHPRRHRQRGYNQAALIAKLLADQPQFNALYTPNVLERIKDTPAQARIKDRRERVHNIVGAFALHPDAPQKIAGRDIVLIDDVATTGATLREAAQVLKKAGAREILLCAVAH